MLKSVLIFATVVACAIAAATEDATANNQNSAPIKGQEFLSAVETHDGTPKKTYDKCVNAMESKIQYLLYTREKTNGEPINANPTNLSESSLNVKKQLKVIVHSLAQDKSWVEPVVRDYLYTQNVDVLVVDWSAYSLKCDAASTSTVITPFVGKSLGKILRTMIAVGHSGSKMHLIGFSHGAHIVGIAGRSLAPHLADRITALDPLRLDETDQPGSGKLLGGDAKFIDTIVTSIPGLSFDEEIGQVTFYPNGGLTDYHAKCQHQTNAFKKMICGHAFAYTLFSESLVSPKKFPAVKCNTYNEFLYGRCNNAQKSHMGEYVERSARGKYFLSTNDQYPYDKGLNFPSNN